MIITTTVGVVLSLLSSSTYACVSVL